MVAVFGDWILPWLDLVVLYDRALAKMGSQSWRAGGTGCKSGLWLFY
jgi:hypothetical protein